MTCRILATLALLSLAACSAPMDQAPEPLAEPMVEATALEALDPCESSGDGIGGTGCPEL
ncbi:hypothetical protein [uncultured Pelagimonas sp.]|uniref:hypothetical protein n=1 Tax=uncultured Pelagimonas sp. TaxID=1618102 RepID=UPI0026191AFC|nr:hypothetical protein [uncultured Pelagimonas sp.]